MERRTQRRLTPDRRPVPRPRELAKQAIREVRRSSAADAWTSWRSSRRARWDLPPEPRDWRWAIGLLGRTLVITGLLLLGFVGYQLWGTGIETARAQSALRERLTEELAAPTASRDVMEVITEPTANTLAVETSGIDGTEDGPPGDTDAVGLDRAEPTLDAPQSESVEEPIVILAQTGDPIARIEMPTIGADHIVVAGIGVDELRLGPGHFPDTPLPGQLGNAAIAGHRTTYGQPFHDVDLLAPGDEIVITTAAGRFVYLVEDTTVVDPADYAVVSTLDRTRATLTLTSCHPKWSAAKRIIVRAGLDSDRSDPVLAATDYNGSPLWVDEGPVDDGPSSSDGVAPTTTEKVAPTTTAPGASPTTTTAPDESPAATTTPTRSGSGSGSGDVSSLDPVRLADDFGRGWLHDTSAIWHVLGWGSGLLGIVLASRVLSRRRRSHLVGYGLGLLPGLVVLYFVYENVNRLLPPNL